MSDDKIFTETDYIRQHEAAEEFLKTVTDPRHKYVVHFNYNGQQMTEDVWACNAEEAEQHFKAEWAKVGVYFPEIQIKGEE